VLTSGGAIDVNASAPADSLAIDSSGNVIIGGTTAVNTGASTGNLTINGSGNAILNYTVGGSGKGWIYHDATNFEIYNNVAGAIKLFTDGSERMRIDSSGNLLVGKTALDNTTSGIELRPGNDVSGIFTSSSAITVLLINRQNSDGTLISFRQANTQEGSISVSGTTVSYNGGHLSRWAQTTGPKDDTLVKGTVLSNLDEMNVYTDADGNPVDNEQLNKVKVSDVEGDANVAGVFVNWTYDEAHSVDEINMAMTGDMIIRIAQGVAVQRGDLLMSAGDGTAKPQEDDIVRSKTVAKVTSTHVTCTYEDGSYCVPCVLMAC
jgi:hypothetical protein